MKLYVYECTAFDPRCQDCTENRIYRLEQLNTERIISDRERKARWEGVHSTLQWVGYMFAVISQLGLL